MVAGSCTDAALGKKDAARIKSGVAAKTTAVLVFALKAWTRKLDQGFSNAISCPKTRNGGAESGWSVPAMLGAFLGGTPMPLLFYGGGCDEDVFAG